MDCSTTLADVSRFVSRALDKASSMETVFSEATGLVHASDYIALRYFESHDSCSVVSTSIAKCNAAELKATFMAYPNSVSKFVSETTIMGRACAWVVTLDVSHNTHLLFMGTDSWDISESTLEIIGAVIRNLLSSFPYDPCYLEKVVREFPEDEISFDAPCWTLTIDDKTCTRVAVSDWDPLFKSISDFFAVFKNIK